jgi:hypothetical protein
MLEIRVSVTLAPRREVIKRYPHAFQASAEMEGSCQFHAQAALTHAERVLVFTGRETE